MIDPSIRRLIGAVAIAAVGAGATAGVGAFAEAGHRVVGHVAEIHLRNSRALKELRAILAAGGNAGRCRVLARRHQVERLRGCRRRPVPPRASRARDVSLHQPAVPGRSLRSRHPRRALHRHRPHDARVHPGAQGHVAGVHAPRGAPAAGALRRRHPSAAARRQFLRHRPAPAPVHPAGRPGRMAEQRGRQRAALRPRGHLQPALVLGCARREPRDAAARGAGVRRSGW